MPTDLAALVDAMLQTRQTTGLNEMAEPDLREPVIIRSGELMPIQRQSRLNSQRIARGQPAGQDSERGTDIEQVGPKRGGFIRMDKDFIRKFFARVAGSGNNNVVSAEINPDHFPLRKPLKPGPVRRHHVVLFKDLD